jgi:hypothetical protein
MVEEVGITDNPDRVGFYSGLVVSYPALLPRTLHGLVRSYRINGSRLAMASSCIAPPLDLLRRPYNKRSCIQESVFAFVQFFTVYHWATLSE